MKIDQTIIEKTIHCKKEFECLHDVHNSCCIHHKIIRCVEESVLFVKCNDCLCRYNMMYGGNNSVCSCPVRMEIYRKHNK